MDEDDVLLFLILATCAQMQAHIIQKLKCNRRKRKVWVKSWLRRRDEKGAYNDIIQELRLEDRYDYRKYMRMNF